MKTEPQAEFHPEIYDKILIDGTIFVNPIPPELLARLQPEKLYISRSFVAECELLKPCMSVQQQAVLEQNLAALDGKISISRILDHAQDNWGNLCALSERRGKFLFITGNRLLVEKIILRQLQVDVYDLQKLEFLPAATFASIRDRYPCRFDRMGDGTQKLQKNMLVYRKDRTLIMLKCCKDSGTEACIYEVPEQPDILVKILKPRYRTEQKLENIRNLLELQERLRCPWAAFPVELVYRDADLTEVMGFAMPAFRSASLDRWSNHRARHDYEIKFSQVLLWCRMIASQVAYLQVFGICVSDFNKENFLVPQDREGILMLDTDSFNLGSYYGGRVSPDAGPALRDRSRNDVCNKADIMDLCQERLYELMFMLLNETAEPEVEGCAQTPLIQKNGGAKEFVAKEEKWSLHFSPGGERRYLFPGRLWTLMEQVFTENVPPVNLPSLDALLYAVLETEKQLAKAPEECDLTYIQLQEQFRRDADWPINGLGTAPEPPPQEAPPAKEPPPAREHQVRRPRPRTRRVGRENPFVPSRLMELTLRHPEDTVPEYRKHTLRAGIGSGRINLERQERLRQAVRQEEARTRTRIWILVLAWLLVLTAGLVWLLCFGESELALQAQKLAAELVKWLRDVLPYEKIPRVLPGSWPRLTA